MYREIVNSLEHWEGVGHFSFIYFYERQLCQCSHGDFSISPSKRYAVLQDGPTGKMLLYNVRTEGLSGLKKSRFVRVFRFRQNNSKRENEKDFTV